MINKIALFTLFFTCTSIVMKAQNPDKKKIDYTVFNDWKSLRNIQISDNGRFASFEINPQYGDGVLIIYALENGKTDTIARGYDAKFAEQEKFLVCKLKPKHQLIRQAKIDKKKESEFPKDSLLVYDLSQSKITLASSNIKSFFATQESNLLAVHHTFIKYTFPPLTKKEIKKKIKAPEIKSEGFYLDIYTQIAAQPKAPVGPGNKLSFRYVTEYTASKKGESVVFIQSLTHNKTDSSYVRLINTNEKQSKIIFSCVGVCKSISVDENGKQVAFLMSADTGKVKIYDLWYWKEGNSTASNVVDRSNSFLKSNHCVSEFGQLRFSKNGERLFFGTNTIPQKEPKDTLPDDEKYRLDLWSYTDIQLQPEQLKMVDQERKKSYLAVYYTNNGKTLQLGDSINRNIRPSLKGNGKYAISIDEIPYERSKSWDFPFPSDYYVINLETGEKKLALKKHRGHCELSESGKYLVYYVRNENKWYALDHQSGKSKLLTDKINAIFYEDDNGNPAEEDAIGIMGYTENDEAVFIYSKYDIYKVDLNDPAKKSCITMGKGEETKTVYRFVNLDFENDFIDENFILLHSFNDKTRKEGYTSITKDRGLRSLLETDHKYTLIRKARNKEQVLFTRMNFTTFPNVHLSDLTFLNTKQISDANPQQKEYSWGTVELVSWTTPKGRKLEGLLYKPENFDSRRKYPLLVYFYEKYTQDIHNYYSPRPSASIINPTEYASNGYVIFIPDILYSEGSPGEDAYDCIVSGTDHVVSLGFINPERMGLQGQSWGGYQTAYLVTQTNKYRAAMAGAPVSNMTSAYGGIRWGSGWVRAFQYEKGQSRLGVSLWQDRERYIKNSPLFFADKVETPLLIMHNDQDGAVPWYQGVEYFNALRRLDKKVWMLNYNDDDHNLRRRANQFDLTIRMRQFFDHYLLDQPMPEWMKNGLPAIDKGRKTGYELIQE